MNQSVYGLDISDHSAEIVSLRKHRGLVVLEHFASVEIPPGVITRGSIEDAVKWNEILAALVTRVAGARRGRIRIGVSLPEANVFSGVFELPATIDSAMAAQAAALEAFETFPMSFERIGADAAVIERAEKTQSVLYAAADRTLIDRYLTSLKSVGADALFLDVESNALARALVPRSETKAVVIADIGAQTTMLAVVENNAVRHVASIPLGGNHMTTAIETKLNISLEKAEELKRKVGFDPTQDEGRIFFILQGPMMELMSEISRTIEHYQKKTGHVIESLVLAGGTSLTPSIVEYLSSNLSAMTVRLGEPLRDIRLGPGLKPEVVAAKGIFLATAIGVALRGIGNASGPLLDLRKAGDISSRSQPKNFIGSVGGFLARVRATVPSAKASTKGRSKRKAILAGLFALAALVLVGGIIFSTVRRLREGTISPQPVPDAVAPAETVDATVTVSADPVPEAGPDVLTGRVSSIELSGSTSLTASNSQSAAVGKAKGTVIIQNTTAQSFTFSASTRVSSKEGVLFRLDSTTQIPANGSVDAVVTADKEGPEGNVGPTTFTFPGLSADMQTKVTARSTAVMAGGGGTSTTVTEEDIAAAKAKIMGPLKEQAAAEFQTSVGEGERFLPELVYSQETVWDGPRAGDSGNEFDVSMTIRFSSLLIPEAEIIRRLQEILATPGLLGTPRYTVSGLTAGARKAVVHAEAEVRQ